MEPALSCLYSCVGPNWPEFLLVGCQCQTSTFIMKYCMKEEKAGDLQSEAAAVGIWTSRGTACPEHWPSTWLQWWDYYLWLGICSWALLSEPKLQPDEPLGKILKCRSREKVTLATMFELASACIAWSELKRIMIFWAVESTFCTILYLPVIKIKLLIVKKAYLRWWTTSSFALSCLCVNLCWNSFHIFS